MNARLNALLVLATSVHLTGCSTSSENKPFFFVHMTDPQFGMFTENKDLVQETELFTQAIAHVNRLQPAFVVITGDLTHRPHDAEQTAEFRRILGRLDKNIPVYLLPGNHDAGGTSTHDSIGRYRDIFGPNRFAFRMGCAAFVGVNSCIIHTPDEVEDLSRQQREWLEEILADLESRPPRHIIVFQHHPLFLHRADEEDDYFNMPSDKRKDLLALYKQYSVTAVMAGHYHRNSHARDGDMEMIVTGPIGKPLGNDPPGLRIVRVYPDRIEHEYHPLDSIPETMEFRR